MTMLGVKSNETFEKNSGKINSNNKPERKNQMSQQNSITKTKKFEHLTYAKRSQIEVLLKAKIPKTQIASIIGISRATLYRELKRGSVVQKNSNWTFRTQYFADSGQDKYERNRTDCHRKSLFTKYQNEIEELKSLMKRKHWSIGAAYSQLKPCVCLRTVYNYLCKKNKKRQKTNKPPRNHKALGRSIELRPQEILTREEFGHYEADTIVSGKGSNSALLTVIERKTRMGFVVKLKEKTSAEVLTAFEKLNLPMKSITTDNGSEFAGLEKALQIPIYYTHPYSSWEKGSIERFNGLIRRFIPKGTDISELPDEKILGIKNYFNTLPRKILDWQTPEIFFNYCLISSCI